MSDAGKKIPPKLRLVKVQEKKSPIKGTKVNKFKIYDESKKTESKRINLNSNSSFFSFSKIKTLNLIQYASTIAITATLWFFIGYYFLKFYYTNF